MLIGTALLWLAILVVAVLVLMRLRARPTPADPRRLLAERFARGEIDEQEYRHALDVLADPPRPTR
jgi:putative membrane protein